MIDVNQDKVLVTGGTGFLGTAIKSLRPTWTYIGKKDVNLLDKNSFYSYMEEHGPFDSVVHLAARVGGIIDNIKNPIDFLNTNLIINTNVLEVCYELGVKRVLASLSTCAFPEKIRGVYPFSEDALLDGPPPITNRAYAMSKRVLQEQLNAYYDTGYCYNSFTPSNLYGPGDKFDDDKSHFIAKLIKDASTKRNIKFLGDGSPIRQQLYVYDAALLILMLLTKHNDRGTVIIAPDESYSIKETIQMAKDVLHLNFSYSFTGELNGQHRKDGSNKLLKSIIGGDFKFTPLEEGLKETYRWYNNNYGK